jgi:hypothetical protein
MAAQLTSKVMEQEIDALVKNTTSQDIAYLIARFREEHPSAPPLSQHDIDNLIKARAIGQYMQKPRGRPPKNKDPLGAEEVDAEVIPPAVIATPASETEADLQQKLDVTTEQLRNAHAENVEMRKRMEQLQAQMEAMQMNNTLLEVAEQSITNQQEQKRYQQLKLVKENETIHEKMNDVLNKLDTAPIVIVPEEDRQVSCFFTKKNLTLGDKKIYVVQYLGGPFGLKTVITSEGQQFRKVHGYEALIIAQYPDWDTFIEKHGGVAKSTAQGAW